MGMSVPEGSHEGDGRAPLIEEAAAESEQPLTPEQEIEIRRLQLEQTRADQDALKSEREYNAIAYRDTNRVATLEAYMRAALAAILVVGTIAAVFVGILRGITGSDLAQYLAPITGLAGLAVGYFFGRGAAGSQSDGR